MTMKKNHMNVLCLLIIALCYINNSEAADCNASTGPSGVRKCLRFSGFNDYQWATCRTDAYIRSKNNGSHYCRNDYCLYQCMVEMYGRRSGDVYSSCRCTPNPVTTVSPATTVSPQIKVGTCSPYTGPSGARQCIKLPGFTDYQWVTCRTDSYLRSKGHFCRNHFHTYCLYQCMLEKYSRESGVVYSSCRCTPSSPNNKVGGENSASENEKHTFVFVVFVAISSLFVS